MKLIHTMDPVQFDLYASSKYREKATDARRRELDFSLTFAEFRRILAKQRCEYTGIALTLPVLDGGKQKKTDLTIERIDNSKGYIRGNCLAVCYAANNIKAVFENPQAPLDISHAVKMFEKIGLLQQTIANKA
jgi:hypothetical protein